MIVRKQADILLVVTCSFALTVIIVASPFASPIANPIRAILGLPFVLFFPGYALTAALFPRKDDLDPIERIALSLGLSIAVVPLTGFALNQSPWGISLIPILASVTLFIVLTATAGLIRRRMLPVQEAFGLKIDIHFPEWSQVHLADRLLAVGMVLALVALGGAAYFVATSRDSSETFTEFAVLGPEGAAASYPSKLRVGENATVILRIVNREGQRTADRVDVRIDRETTDSIDGLQLEDGERWQQSVRLTPAYAGDDQKVEFLLYKDGQSDPYRRLHLWLTVEPALEDNIPLLALDSHTGPVPIPEAAPASDLETPPPEPTPRPAERPTVHTVVSGENLTRIAGYYGLRLTDLLAANDIANPNLIHPGQRIHLPPVDGEGDGQ